MYDCIIIGAGIIGSSVARELSKSKAKILVVERKNDVSCGTTKANSGIIHAGYDAVPGSLKAKFNVEGAKMYPALSKELDFPFGRNGAFVLSFSEDGKIGLEELMEKAKKNGVEGCSILSGDEIRKIEPSVSKDVVMGLFARTSGIASPYEMCIAMAENAYKNGVEFSFEKEVESINKVGDIFEVKTVSGELFEGRTVVNCAGVYADTINNQISSIKYHITARKGEYCLMDKDLGCVTKATLFQLPTKMGKGVLVAPTTHCNLIVGPSATDVDDKDNVATTYEKLDEIWKKATLTVPSLSKSGIITQFSGLRAHEAGDDYVIGFAKDVPGFFNCLGIESPGLASSPAIASYAAKEIKNYLSLEDNPDFDGKRKAIKHISSMSDEELIEAVKENKEYGHIVCRCEVVSEAEIREAIRRKPGAKDLDGIKRRVRAGMGRCQMGFCTPRVMEILSEELGVSLEEITKKGGNSPVVEGRIKE